MQVAILYAIVVLIWGSTWAAITFQLGVVAEEVSVAYRFGLGSLALFLFAISTRRSLTIPIRHYPMVMLMGALMFSANYLFTYYAISHITSGLVAVVFSLIVVANGFFEMLFFGRQLAGRLIVASVLGVAGIACMFWPEIRSVDLATTTVCGILLAVIAVTFASLGNMAAIVSTDQQLPVVTVNAHGMAWGAITSALVALVLGREFNFLFQADYIVSLLYLAVFGSAIAFGCYLALLRKIGSARAAYTSVLFPVVALVVSTLVEEYQWSIPAIVGLLFIVAGNWLALTRIERFDR